MPSQGQRQESAEIAFTGRQQPGELRSKLAVEASRETGKAFSLLLRVIARVRGSKRCAGECEIGLEEYARGNGGVFHVSLPLSKCPDTRARLAFDLTTTPAERGARATDLTRHFRFSPRVRLERGDFTETFSRLRSVSPPNVRISFKKTAFNPSMRRTVTAMGDAATHTLTSKFGRLQTEPTSAAAPVSDSFPSISLSTLVEAEPARLAALERQLAELRESEAAERRKATELEREMRERETRFEEEIRGARRLAESEVSAKAAIEARLSRLSAERSEEIAAFQSRFAKLQRDLQDALGEKERAFVQLAVARQESEARAAAFAQLKSERSLESESDFRAQIAEMQTAKESAIAELGASQRQIASLQSELAKLRSLVEIGDKNRADFVAEISELRARVAFLESESAARKTSAEKRIEKLNAALFAKTAENDDLVALNSQNVSLKKKVKSLETRIDENAKTLGEVVKRECALLSLRETLERKNDEKEKTIKSLSEEFERLKAASDVRANSEFVSLEQKYIQCVRKIEMAVSLAQEMEKKSQEALIRILV